MVIRGVARATLRMLKKETHEPQQHTIGCAPFVEHDKFDRIRPIFPVNEKYCKPNNCKPSDSKEFCISAISLCRFSEWKHLGYGLR